MIKFEDIWQDHQLSDLPSTIIFFHCNHCNSRLSEDSLNLAVFLYGFFSLHNSKSSYIGITCPNCMNTILIKEKRSPASLFIKLSSIISFGDLVIHPKLTYFTSIYHHDSVCKCLQDLSPLSINFFHAGVSQDGLKHISDHLDCHVADNDLNNHLVSYVDSGFLFPPIELFVFYVNENHIEDLIKYEQENNVRIIPRYMHQFDLLDRIEVFCATNGFDSNLDRLMGPTNANLRLVKSQDSDVDQFISDDRQAKNFDNDILYHKHPELFSSSNLNPERIDIARRADLSPIENEFENISEFMKILDADPYPWDSPCVDRGWIKTFWKRPCPFKDQEIPTILADYKENYEDSASSNQHEKMVAEIKPVFSKSNIQTYISSLFPSFIWDYSQIVKRYAFSYSDVWNLKERYLEKIFQCVRN